MKKLALTMMALSALGAFANAGTEIYSGKEMKQVAQMPAPCPEWYGDQEWNVTLWGAYAFSGNDNDRHFDEDDFDLVDGETARVRDLIGDHGWGGGGDIKYFFHKYFGVGVEAFGLSVDRNIHVDDSLRLSGLKFHDDDDGVGALLGTVTLRFPIGCSRFAPYVFAGGGAIWGERDEKFTFVGVEERFVRTRDEDETQAMGQVGGGMEIRFTRHVGWMADVSWNFTEHDDFGMVRSGLNFAF